MNGKFDGTQDKLGAVYVNRDGNPEVVNWFRGINSPRSDLGCDCCGTVFEELPEYDHWEGEPNHSRLLRVHRRTHPDFDQMGSAWLCRDCIGLDDDEYLEKLDSVDWAALASTPPSTKGPANGATTVKGQSVDG